VSSAEDFAVLAIPEVTGLSGTSYELPGEQGLAYGTYYWRVRAVDGAQNIGEWSEADSFKSGLLPLWAFIVSAALLAVLIGVLVYFFAVRRGGYYD
jgi:ABC-type branched-subunit amino acid transport system permease subunit